MRNPSRDPFRHYYGDWVRRLFIAGAAIMVLILPTVVAAIPEFLYVSIIAIIVVSAAAGLTSPFLWSTILNLFVSVLGVLFFEYYAVFAHLNPALFRGAPEFFWASQALALLFVAALYFSTKTLRGAARQKKVDLDEENNGDDALGPDSLIP